MCFVVICSCLCRRFLYCVLLRLKSNVDYQLKYLFLICASICVINSNSLVYNFIQTSLLMRRQFLCAFGMYKGTDSSILKIDYKGKQRKKSFLLIRSKQSYTIVSYFFSFIVMNSRF